MNFTQRKTVNAMENDNLILSEDGKILIGVKDDSITHVVIPEGVTTIGKRAFFWCRSLQNIDIPDNVTTIRESAFCGCQSLQSIDIPDSVTTIGDSAFWFCESLQRINIPNSVTRIGDSAFSYCKSLQSIHVAENNSNYTSIDGVLFSKDKSTIIQIPLGNKEFKIPDGVTAIEDRVLGFCKSLQRINIPNSVARIGDRAFFWCKSLQNIHVAENNPNYSSIDGVLFSKDKRTIIQMPLGKEIEEFTIPNGVTTIGNRAFSGCESLQRINIPNSVTRIGDSAFDECKSLQIIHVAENNPNYSSMNGVLFSKDKRTIIRMPLGKEIEEFKIPNGVTVIGSSAFCGCQSLQSINIPDSVTTIGSSAFSCCKHLKIIHIAESNPNYSSIDGVLFSKDKRTIIQMPLGKEIEEFTIPNGVKTIENCAFRGCESLERINIPNSVTRIGDSAFFWCKSLQNIHVAENNPNYSSIDGVLFSKDKSIIIRMPLEKEIEEFTIPNGVTSIGISAFCDCKLLQSIDIPDSVTTIGNSAFRGCSSLQSINIPNSVTTIGDWAFFWCKSLQRISIPNSVTTIGERAFDNCKSLKIIHVSEGNPNYTSIDGVVCSKDKRTLIIVPNGKDFHDFKIPNSVTTIGKSAFGWGSSFQSIDIPDSVTTIGDFAFEGCTALQSIDIPNSVTTIGSSAFSYCKSLQNIHVAEDNPNYTSIDGVVCSKDKRTLIIVPNGKDFHDFKIPNSVTTIGKSAFGWGSSFQSIDIPDSVTTIGDFAFEECTALQSIDIPNSVTIIGERVFEKCTSLQAIHMHHKNIMDCRIDEKAFNEVDFDQCSLYIPSGTRWAYRHHPVFGQFKNIVTKKEE